MSSFASTHGGGGKQQQSGWEKRLGENVWSRMPKVNSELLTLTYGAMVMQLVKDYEEVPLINQQLEKMGHNIGMRLVDEFLAKSGVTACSTFKDTAEVIAKVAFKMFLGINVDVAAWNSEATAFSLIFYENPLTDFVDLPPQYQDLHYCNMLCGVVRGALEMVQLNVECRYIRDTLKGDEVSEMRVELKGMVKSSLDEYKDS